MKRFFGIFVFVFCVSSLSAAAEVPAGMEAAMERAKYVKAYKAALDEADRLEALVYVEEGLKNADPQVRRLALEWALGNADKDIQDLAIRELYAGRDQMLVRFLPPASPSDAQKTFLERNPTVELTKMTIDEKGQPAALGYLGSFTNGGFELTKHNARCSLIIDDVAAKSMSGIYVCPGMDPIAARIELE